MKLLGHRNAVTICILSKDLLLMKILRKTRVCKGKLYLFPNRRVPSNCHFIMFVGSCSDLLILPPFFFLSFSILSWVTLCCGGCLPVSWSKPLFTRANLNILTMPAPWLWIPGDFFMGPQLVFGSRSVAQSSLTPGFGVSLETCSCELIFSLSERGWMLYPSLSRL